MQNQHYAQEAGVTAPENNPMDTPMVFLQKGPSEHPTKPTEPTGPAPDMHQAEAFLNALDPFALQWCFQTFDDGPEKRGHLASTQRGTWLELAPRLQTLNAQGAGVFVTVNEVAPGKPRKAENITRARAVFADFDDASRDNLAALKCVALEPSILVESSPGKFHAYWLVNDMETEDFRPLQQAIVEKLGTDNKVKDLPRVMRVPGFIHKKGAPELVKLLPASDKTYTMAELQAAFAPAQQPAPQPPIFAPLESDLNAPTAAPRGAHDAYTQRAIERATSAVLNAGPGARNDALNASAYGLARLAAADRLDWGQVSQTLERAAVATGLAPAEVRATLNSAWGKGSTKPNFEGMPRDNRQTLREGSAWPELVPLPEEADDIAAPEEFPFAALGHLLGDAAKAIATDVQAPDAMAGGSVLAAASLAVQPLVDVVLPHGQVSPTSLFLVTGGGSGERKTAVDDVACGEIAQRRKVAARQFHHAMEDYWKERDNHKKGDPEPVEPLLQSLTIGDATAEGVKRLLKGQSSVGVFSAEGGEVLGGHSMKDTNRMAAMAFFLKGWGAEAIDSMRGGEGYTSLLGRRMALHVMAQPILLRQLLSDPLADGQGFLARCLIAQPQSLAGSRFFNGCNPKENPAVLAYSERIGHLLDTRPQCWPEGDGYELKPRQLCLNQEACNLWIEFYNSIEYMQGTGKELEHARAFASKVPEQAARIAGVIAVFNDPQTTQIDESAMFGAMELMKFYLSEHLRLTGKGRQEQHDRRLRELLDWLQKEGPVVPAAAVLQKCPRAVRSLKAKGIAPLLDELARRGYIRSIGKAWEVRNGI